MNAEHTDRHRDTVQCPRCRILVRRTSLSDPNRCHKDCPLNEKPKPQQE